MEPHVTLFRGAFVKMALVLLQDQAAQQQPQKQLQPTYLLINHRIHVLTQHLNLNLAIRQRTKEHGKTAHGLRGRIRIHVANGKLFRPCVLQLAILVQFAWILQPDLKFTDLHPRQNY